MNFQTVLEELDKIYEELPAEEAKKETDVAEEEVTEACDKTLNEAADDEEVTIDDEPIVEDETAEDEIPAEDTQFVLECAKCGALVIKPESEVKADDAADLVNADEACQYCEEAEGYKILGNLVVLEAPAEEPAAEEMIEEALKEEVKKEVEEEVSEEATEQ